MVLRLGIGMSSSDEGDKQFTFTTEVDLEQCASRGLLPLYFQYDGFALSHDLLTTSEIKLHPRHCPPPIRND